ncbi:MAG: ABC transporter permease [Chloroflexi bacterium]|nr:ABC transporter permease [Chloroflexota bacterium]
MVRRKPARKKLLWTSGRLLFWAVVIAVLVYLTLPTVVVIMASFNPTAILSFPPEGLSLHWYQNMIERSEFQRGFFNSVYTTSLASLAAAIIGIAAAIIIERANLPGAGLLAVVLLSPLMVPGVVTGLGLLLFAAWSGLMASREILVLGHIILIIPFVLRSVWVSLQNIDTSLEKAAASLGANPAKVLFHVTLPMLQPGIFAGLLFAIIISFNEFVASVFISARTTEILPVAIYTYVRNFTDPTVAAVSTAFIVSTTLILLVVDRIAGISKILQIK